MVCIALNEFLRETQRDSPTNILGTSKLILKLLEFFFPLSAPTNSISEKENYYGLWSVDENVLQNGLASL